MFWVKASNLIQIITQKLKLSTSQSDLQMIQLIRNLENTYTFNVTTYLKMETELASDTLCFKVS